MTILKLAVSIPFFAISILLLFIVILIAYLGYNFLKRLREQAVQDQAKKAAIASIAAKKAAYAKTSKSIEIDDYDEFVAECLAPAPQLSINTAAAQKKRHQMNKLKRNRKRSKQAKQSRKKNRH